MTTWINHGEYPSKASIMIIPVFMSMIKVRRSFSLRKTRCGKSKYIEITNNQMASKWFLIPMFVKSIHFLFNLSLHINLSPMIISGHYSKYISFSE